ncbi:MAG: hypothetical protein ACRELG_04500 [Gemmataceae bacterium]
MAKTRHHGNCHPKNCRRSSDWPSQRWRRHADPDPQNHRLSAQGAENRRQDTRQTHYCSHTFENAVWHTHAVYDALRARPDIRSDLIVGHSGFGSTLFLRELYDCPLVNYFEYFYLPHDSDMDFRPDFPVHRTGPLARSGTQCHDPARPAKLRSRLLPHPLTM